MCRMSPMVTWGRKNHIPRFRDAEGIRRNDFMPTFMIRTMLPLTPSSVPLCPLPSPCDQWPTCGKHIGGHWELVTVAV